MAQGHCRVGGCLVLEGGERLVGWELGVRVVGQQGLARWLGWGLLQLWGQLRWVVGLVGLWGQHRWLVRLVGLWGSRVG